MAYEKQTWSDVQGETPINANRLNHMEDGIEDAGKTGGVEVGTIVEWEDDVAIPEGYEEVETGYSTSEVKTGEYWIDGKPIYRKVMEVTIPKTDVDGTSSTYEYAVSSNTNEILTIQGHADINSSTPYRIYAPIWVTTAGYTLYFRCKNDSKQLQIVNAVKAFSEVVAKITVEYTKTTD